MLDLGLSAADLAHVERAYRRSHVTRTTVQILDLDHNIVGTVNEALIDGMVTVDWDAGDATRSCEMVFYDPDYTLGFDVADSSQGVWFFDRMLQVRIEMYVDALERWIEFPVFTGPVRGFKRTNSLVTVKCLGKDIFARRSWPSYVIDKGTNKVEAIRRILTEAGETKFRFEASSTDVLDSDRNVNRALKSTPFGLCRRWAAEMDMLLYYNGRGEAVLRHAVDDAVDWYVYDGDDGLLLNYPDVEADYDRIANVVRVESSQNAKIFANVEVDEDSDISPTRLQRGGKPFYFGHEHQSDTVKTVKQAQRAAEAILEDRQNASYNVKFDTLPIYAAEEVDRVRVRADGDVTQARITSMSFGLGPAPMSMGYNRMVAPVLAQIRRI